MGMGRGGVSDQRIAALAALARAPQSCSSDDGSSDVGSDVGSEFSTGSSDGGASGGGAGAGGAGAGGAGAGASGGGVEDARQLGASSYESPPRLHGGNSPPRSLQNLKKSGSMMLARGKAMDAADPDARRAPTLSPEPLRRRFVQHYHDLGSFSSLRPKLK